jgi:hypothetical protein
MARSQSTKSNARKAPARSRKKKTSSSAFGRFMELHGKALAFIVAFAVVGGLATYFVQAGTTRATGTIMGVGDMCLDNMDGKAVNGNRVSLWTCDGTSAQQWTLEGDGTIRNNGYCLDVKGASKANKTLVQIYKCNGTVAQQWSIKTNGTIINPNSGLCLDDQYAKTVDGNPIWMYTCNGTVAQKWRVPTASTPAPTPTPTPPKPTDPTPTNPSGQAMPTGNITGWKQIFADDFKGSVPKGAFSDCNHNTDTPQAYCGGLKNYGDYYANWWAYPSGWEDTAKSGADGNTGAPFGGTYEPQETISVTSGVLRVNMFRPAKGGDNKVAAPVPRKCMDRQYGRYVERFKVTKADAGFKSAHLFYDGGYEIDYPENDYNGTISAYTHPGGANFSTNTKYTDGWHTTAIEWTASSVKFYMDGKLIGTTTNKVPKLKMSWILQNESSIMGPYAKPGASATIDTDWVTCYAPA